MTASADGTGKVYNVHTGEQIASLLGRALFFKFCLGHKGEISKVSFNPSGNKIITGSADNTARVLYHYLIELIALRLVNWSRS